MLLDIVEVDNGSNSRQVSAISRPGDLAGLAQAVGQQELEHEQPATAGV